VERSASDRGSSGHVSEGAAAADDRGKPRGASVRSGQAQIVTANGPFEPEAIIAALNRAGVRYIVVGGLAAGAHGVVAPPVAST
jgi:hypothetical protein